MKLFLILTALGCCILAAWLTVGLINQTMPTLAVVPLSMAIIGIWGSAECMKEL